MLLSAEPSLQSLHSSFKPVYYAEIDGLNSLAVTKSYTHKQLYKLQDPKTKVEANPIINPAPHTYRYEHTSLDLGTQNGMMGAG